MSQTPEARVTTSPGGDPIAQIEFESVSVTAYHSPNDAAFVIEVDTQEGTGEVRVYVNEGQVFAGDPEVDGSPEPG